MADDCQHAKVFNETFKRTKDHCFNNIYEIKSFRSYELLKLETFLVMYFHRDEELLRTKYYQRTENERSKDGDLPRPRSGYSVVMNFHN